jgi:hypothetical protein
LQDILKTEFRAPNTVYILAPGWNGRLVFDKIPEDAFVITVNKGVTVPAVQKHIWLAEDMGMITLHPWFDKFAKDLIRFNNGIMKPRPTPVFGKGKMTERYPDVPYYYEPGTTLGYRPNWQPQPGVLRGGATIASKALQLAVHKGAKRVVLVGVDMKGRKYFDGTKSISTMIDAGGKWWCLYKWDKLLGNVKRMGVEVVSLSETALDVPVVVK